MEKKNIIETIKSLFSNEEEVKFVDVKTVDGKILRVPDMVVDSSVTEITEEGEVPVEDGEYELEDGIVLVVENGVISEIKEVESEEEEVEEPVEEVVEPIEEEMTEETTDELVLEIPTTDEVVENVEEIVDEVTEVLRLPKANIDQTPELITTEVQQRYVKGVGKLEDRLLILIDLANIFSQEEIEGIKEIKEQNPKKEEDNE